MSTVDRYEQDDAESVYTPPVPPGVPVDPAEPHRTLYADLVARQHDRRPIVPASLRNPEQRRTLARWAVRYGGHTIGYHATRSPKYAAKAAWYALAGLVVGVYRVARWAMAEDGNWTLRQHAADRNDPDAWLRLDNARRNSAVPRWQLVAGLAVLAAAAVVVLLSPLVPWWARWVALGVAVPVLARIGRPADRPIIDRVSTAARYRKLTAELVRTAVVACRIPAIKDPGQLHFPREIHRDGPGYMAVVDLPHGVEAVEVIERRGRLASGLRLPIDQVWPDVDGGHTGRLALWVGDEPASQMRQPDWPLLRAGQVDVFRPFPFATDPRLQPVDGELMYRNWLFGGVPGSGKTFTMRLLVLAAALDPRVELRGYELKGTGDYDVLEPVCVEYGSGADDDTAEAALGMLLWLRQECGRRAERVKHYARIGKAPENKVTPELASLPGSGLHPLVAYIDEAQELFAHEEYGKQAHRLAPQIVKLGRAYGIVLLIGTQRPDKDSLPPALTANVNTRFCLAVMDQVANDMILGTSAYKNGYRATHFEPGKDAGWGIAVGLGKPGPRRAFYVDGPGAARIVERALRLRGGRVDRPDEPLRATAYNLLADVRAVWIDGQDALWSEVIVPRLQVLRPEVYGDWTVQTFGAAMRAAGVATVSVHRKVEGKGTTRYGVRIEQLDAAIEAGPEPRAVSS